VLLERIAMRHEIEILPDADAVARRGAELVAEKAREVAADHGSFSFAVSGGTTPWAMFAHLRGQDVPWERTTIYQVDERVAPGGDPDRNLTHLRECLAGTPVTVKAMPVENSDLEGAATAYGAELPERLDLVHLGLGDDGHTASLVPGDPVLEVVDRAVAVTQA
jgi:6-phosphogluconolactonase